MQKSAGSVGVGAYRERLGPSLWVLVGAAVVAPMAALVFVQLDTTIALVIGALVGAGVIALLLASAPVVEVDEGLLSAGRAHIDVSLLGDAVALHGQDARNARGPELDPRAWHLIRGGIDGAVVVRITDPDDPAPTWVISSRTPERLVAAIGRARSMKSTPRR